MFSAEIPKKNHRSRVLPCGRCGGGVHKFGELVGGVSEVAPKLHGQKSRVWMRQIDARGVREKALGDVADRDRALHALVGKPRKRPRFDPRVIDSPNKKRCMTLGRRVAQTTQRDGQKTSETQDSPGFGSDGAGSFGG